MQQKVDDREYGEYVVGGLVRSVKSQERRSKRGVTYNEVTMVMDDLSGSHTFRFLDKQIEKYRDLLAQNTVICMRVKIVQTERGGLAPSLNVDFVTPIQKAIDALCSNVEIRVDTAQFTNEHLMLLRDTLARDPQSRTTLTFDIVDKKYGRSVRCVSDSFKIGISESVIDKLLENDFAIRINGRTIEQNNQEIVPENEETMIEELVAEEE